MIAVYWAGWRIACDTGVSRNYRIGRCRWGDPAIRTYLPAACGIRRLQKRDPWAARPAVGHPIVYYIDPHMPKQWVPYVKRGLEEWNPAFAAIGFRHAIVAREVPVRAQDSLWAQLNDGRHDVVSWLPSRPVPVDTGLLGDFAVPWTVGTGVVTDTMIIPPPRIRFGSLGTTDPECDKEGGMIVAPITITGELIDWWFLPFYFYSAAATDPVVSSKAHGDGPVRCPVPAGLASQGITCPMPVSSIGPRCAVCQ